MTASAAGPRRVVVVGAGFGGLSVAKSLAGAAFDVTVVDQHNYHLFQPLLYQVATAGLSPADIASPIRGILRGKKNLSVMLAKVSAVDTVHKAVIAEGRRLGYDYLVIATGAEHAYFGNDWASYAPGLKTIDDATYLRRRILLAFERAETETNPEERRRLLNFVVVGGGPTGVEMAGAIAELAKRALAMDFRSIDPRSTRIILVEAGPRLLAPFDPSLSEAARRSLEQLGVEVRLGAGVTECDCGGVSLGGERIEARTIVWAAGVKASPAAEWLGVPCDRAGRVIVNADLSVPGHPDIFVIGDAAHALGRDGNLLPGVAPVAKQQGQYVARLLLARARGENSPPFRYRDFGSLATIGRKRAVVQMGKLRIHGFFAWVLWSVAHIYFLIGFRNRLIVAMNWMWSYLTFQRGTRLITGMTGSRLPKAPDAEGEPAAEAPQLQPPAEPAQSAADSRVLSRF
jgi:NADH dehydrogenase